MYSAVPKTGSTLIHWALSVLGEKYNNFKVVGFRYMPMYEDTFIGHIKHDYFCSDNGSASGVCARMCEYRRLWAVALLK